VHPVHLDPSIAPLYLLRYSTADLQFVVDIQGKPHHHPCRTLRPTDRNSADVLSRRPDHYQGEEDNKKLVVLPPGFFTRAYARLAGSDEADPSEPHGWKRMTQGLDNGKFLSLQEKIVKNQEEDASKKQISHWTNTHQISKVLDVYWKEDRIVVAGGNDLKRGVIHYFHDTPSAGHPGITNTYKLAKRDIWWPNMKQDVEQYVNGCAICQANKANRSPLRPGLAPITPEHSLPFQTVAMDFITKLPKSGKKGYNTILTITDHDCTKAAIFIPCHETVTAEGVVLLYLRHVYPRFGIPKKIISDRDTRFTSKFAKGLNNALDIKSNMSTAYHPQTDGQSERTNQSLEIFIRCYCNEEQDNWHIWLPMAEFAHNQWPNATTKKAPFDLIMGYVPKVKHIKKPSPVPQVEERLAELECVRKIAWDAMLKVQAMLRMKNPGEKKFQPYKEDNQVWVEGTNLKTLYPSAKLGPKQYGPFKVLKRFSNTVYQVEIPRVTLR
jgi:hypothetical protein